MAAQSPSSSPTAASPSEAKQDAAPPINQEERLANAQAVVRRNVFWALGAGVLPTPLLDVAAVTGVQLKQIKQLSDLYGLQFSSEIAKKIIYSLLGSVGVVGVGTRLGASFAKFIPALGTTLGMVSVPVLTGAFTHAMGQVLIMHFEAGGTLLNFDSTAMRNYFKQEFEKAKETVAQLRHSDAAKPAAKSA
jgi:uncharacterized protein (DUF697 family)